MNGTVTATYDFDEDAMGLGGFIAANMGQIAEDESPVVYVENEDGMDALKAVWIKETLTDGSVAYKLRIRFRA